jgi:hypothetical protein
LAGFIPRFPPLIEEFNLLWRDSSHNFRAAEFRRRCNGPRTFSLSYRTHTGIFPIFGRERPAPQAVETRIKHKSQSGDQIGFNVHMSADKPDNVFDAERRLINSQNTIFSSHLPVLKDWKVSCIGDRVRLDGRVCISRPGSAPASSWLPAVESPQQPPQGCPA